MFDLPVDATDEEIWIGASTVLGLFFIGGLLIYAFHAAT